MLSSPPPSLESKPLNRFCIGLKMASEPQPIPIGNLKHDPAWKHCQMFKNGDRIQLKCLYCFKVFSGGGIHRIKEHLACQKGNASCCSRVPPEVRRAMQQSLEGVVVKKRKKQKIADEIRTNITPDISEMGVFATTQCDVSTGLQLHAPVEANFVASDGIKSKGLDRRKKRRVDSASSPIMTYETSILPSAEISIWSAKEKDEVHMAIGRFVYDVGLPLDVVNSPYFQMMIDAIASKGPRLEATSYHDLRRWILKNSVDEMNALLDRYKATWGRTGCSVMADQWMAGTGRILLNFFVYCPEGTMFLKCVDVSDIYGSADALYKLLKGVVEEVGVRNVVQVITDGTDQYVEAGKRLTATFHTIYWSPCATRSINLMLEDIGKIEWINVTLEHAKSISRFIYNHGATLNMMRSYTDGRELVQPTISRPATDFISLKSMVDLKDNMQSMVTSQEWMDNPLSKHPEGIAMVDIIYNESFWSSCSTIVHLTDPLIGVLSSLGKRPAMGYILAGMHHVKETIKSEMVEREPHIMYWNIIDSRWDQQLQHPLHEAGFFLNPRFFYSLEGDERDKIPSGMLDCIERLVPDVNIQDKINKELILYKNAFGDFGRKMSVRASHMLLPAEWWSTYGGGCPNLARLAIRILSQSCSASMSKPSAIAFEQVHRTRNHLERQRLRDLVFVQYNLRLQYLLKKNKEPEYMDPISTDCIDLAEDWVTEKKELFGNEDSDWVAIHQPAAYNMLLESPNVESPDLIAGFKYQERQNGVKGDET